VSNADQNEVQRRPGRKGKCVNRRVAGGERKKRKKNENNETVGGGVRGGRNVQGRYRKKKRKYQKRRIDCIKKKGRAQKIKKKKPFKNMHGGGGKFGKTVSIGSEKGIEKDRKGKNSETIFPLKTLGNLRGDHSQHVHRGG